MWKALWKKWTIDRPAAFGDLLWAVFVVQFAAFLDRWTNRKMIGAIVGVVLLAIAYHHGVALPPELVLVGDFLAYIDIFTVVLLLGLLSRATTILFMIKQTASRLAQIAGSLMTAARRLDFRHRRGYSSKARTPLAGRKNDDDEGAVIAGLAWA